MRKKLSALAFAALALAAVAGAQDKMSKDEHRSVAQVLDRTVMNVEHEFVPAAEAMPEDKFGFAPSSGEFKGVRTFGEQIKHVAAVNYIFGAAILGEKVPVDVGDESGPPSIKTKAQIIDYLKASFVYVHKAVQTISGQGPWAIFRLMDKAKQENAGPTAFKATFGEGATFATLKFNLNSDRNPFRRGSLWSFRCPAAL